MLKRHLRSRVASGRCAVAPATHSLDLVEHDSHRAALEALRASAEGVEAALAAASIGA